MNVEVDTRTVYNVLLSLADRAEVTHDDLEDIGDLLTNNIRESIKFARTPWGEPFKPLRKITINTRFRGGERYTKRGATTAKFFRHMTGNHIPLNDTGQHIREKITYRVIGKSVVVGILDSQSAKIGRVHQFGAVIRAKNVKYLAIPIGDGTYRFKKQVTIPARPFFPIRGQAVVLPAEWADKIADRLRDVLEI